MNDEEDFIRSLHAEPSNDTIRLVYADWLEERGDDLSLMKTEFLRVECEWAKLPERKRKSGPLRERMQKLARDLDTGWLAVVSKLVIEECGQTFRFKCPKQWEKLRPTDDATVRFCDQCDKNVFYCGTIGEAQEHADNGDCVAVDIGIIRRNHDLHVSLHVMGKISPEYVRNLEELRKPDEVSAEREGKKRMNGNE